ncbi:MAG: molybdopterin-dependent oxidoreductase [Hyphomicrobiaceae bacterium]
MSRLALMIDIERCIGCKSCEVACKAEHALGPGEYRNRVVWHGDTTAPALDFLTLACQHCERPACLRACPVNPKAIEKHPETGVVRVLEDRCTGCGECIVACPYGAMGYDAIDHHAVKCDLCTDRRSGGLKPACATVCPGFAITFGERDALVAQAREQGRSTVDHDAYLLGPSTIYLERMPKEVAPGRIANTTGLALGDRHRPIVVDDPAAKGRLYEDAPAFPYRRSREERQADQVVPGGCNICFNSCSTKFHLRNGRLVRVTGNEEDPLFAGRVCPKSQLTLQLYGSEHRLTHPLKRVGRRGEGRFEQISWAQALDEIAEKLEGVRAKYGSEALAIYAGTRTGTLTRKGYIPLFADMWGTPNVSDTEPFCSESKNLAFKLTQGRIGSGNSYTETDIGTAELYVYFGDNQAETRPVHFGMVNDWRLKRGGRMIAIDPRLTVTASKADLWLPIRTGTDLALALAMIHHIFDRDLHDERFCTNWILGWEKWRDFVRERGYSPEWAAAITDIDAETIRSVAEEIARADGCVLFASRGINQHSNATQTNRTLMFLAAMTGNWGRKGGTFFNMSTPPAIEVKTPPGRAAKTSRPAVRRNAVGWTDAMRDGKPYPIKALITCNNPMAQWPDQRAIREATSALDLLVHIELFQNETSAFADYVLPAATGIEKGEIGRGTEDRRVVWIDRIIDPPGEAKPDGWIWIELGKRFGFDDVLKEKYKDPTVFWDEMCINHPEMRGCTQKRLHSVPWRWVRAPVASEDAAEQETLYLEGTTAAGQPEGHRFPTKSGKLEFWTADLEEKFRTVGLSALPEFYTDREQLIDLPYCERQGDDSIEGFVSPFFMGTPTSSVPAIIVTPDGTSPSRLLRAQGFDTELVTGRPPAPHFHSWMHYAWQAQEMWPDLYVQVHPDKAARHGIADGQRVVIETAHGKIEARAWLHAGIRPDAIFIPIGWGERQPYHPWRSVNFLTDKHQRDPASDHSNLKTYLCRIAPSGE